MNDFGNLNSSVSECSICSSRNHTTAQHSLLNDAAPELLEALKVCHAALVNHPGGDNRSGADLASTIYVIAKAERRS